MSVARRLAAAALDELAEAIVHVGLDLPALGEGWHLTDDGALLVQLRPLHPAEISRLARALRSSPAAPPAP
ncbi:hypothetical protein GCM10009665_73960 [Kitasatospora nipponensis]|uniref:Uncharacterized protein n=1 Tax=Kitasatospora nipponensis TaxID=258049 RepID=A0ABN1T790_9ACTN